MQQIDPEAEIGRKYVDKLLKVRLKSGGEQWVLVHVEVQMAADEKFTWRMYVYNYRIFDKYNREVASFGVLGDDNPDWRPDHFGYRRWGTEAALRFPIVKLMDHAARRPELEKSPNPFATVVLRTWIHRKPGKTMANGRSGNIAWSRAFWNAAGTPKGRGNCSG